MEARNRIPKMQLCVTGICRACHEHRYLLQPLAWYAISHYLLAWRDRPVLLWNLKWNGNFYKDGSLKPNLKWNQLSEFNQNFPSTRLFNPSCKCNTIYPNQVIQANAMLIVWHLLYAKLLWSSPCCSQLHDDVIKWKHFPRYWPFVRGIHRSPVNSPHKGQWRGALMFSLICVWINGWVNNHDAGDLRRYRAHYDVIVMACWQVYTLSEYYHTRNSLV